MIHSKTRSVLKHCALATLTLLLLAMPAVAQQDDAAEEESGIGTWIAEYGLWIAQPTGLNDYVTSLSDPMDPFNTRLLGPSHGTESQGYTKVGIDLSGNKGRVLIHWYGNREVANFSARRPGEFVFGEILAFPGTAGLFNDGLADAVSSETTTVLRDGKLSYSRVAFSNARVEGRWFASYRRTIFKHGTDATYRALVPSFPPLTPPLTSARPDLIPMADAVQMESEYRGRGLEVGMEFNAPLWRDKLSLESSIGFTATRGKVDASYRSMTHFYLGPNGVLEAPYSELGDFTASSGTITGTVDSITQEDDNVGVRVDSLSKSGSIIETSIAIRWQAMKRMSAVIGFRNAYFDGLGVDLQPGIPTSSGNVSAIRQRDRSVNYEGFFTGLHFTF